MTDTIRQAGGYPAASMYQGQCMLPGNSFGLGFGGQASAPSNNLAQGNGGYGGSVGMPSPANPSNGFAQQDDGYGFLPRQALEFGASFGGGVGGGFGMNGVAGMGYADTNFNFSDILGNSNDLFNGRHMQPMMQSQPSHVSPQDLHRQTPRSDDPNSQSTYDGTCENGGQFEYTEN